MKVALIGLVAMALGSGAAAVAAEFWGAPAVAAVERVEAR